MAKKPTKVAPLEKPFAPERLIEARIDFERDAIAWESANDAASLVTAFEKLKARYTQAGLSIPSRDFSPAIQVRVMQAYASQHRPTRRIFARLEAAWDLNVERFIDHFGREIWSTSFLREMARFASIEADWSIAWQALRDSQKARKINKNRRQRVSVHKEWTPADITDAVARYK